MEQQVTIPWWWDYIMVCGPIETVSVDRGDGTVEWRFYQRIWLEPRR